MRHRIGFRDGFPVFQEAASAERMFTREMTRAQLDRCDELIEKSSNPEVVRLAKEYIERWRNGQKD